MKKSLFFIIALSISTLFVSCDKNDDSGNFPKSISTELNVCGVKDLTLFTIDDYNFDEMVDWSMKNNAQTAGACSEIRTGNYVVRNLDWFQYDQATYIVAVKRNKNHKASLSVCGMNDNVKHHFNNTKLTAKEANHLLAYTLDGMNEAGVYAGVNVVPFGQMTTTNSNGVVNYKPTEGENKDKEPLSTSYLLRLILDNADNLTDAERLIKETPWSDSDVMNKAGFQVHWLICTEEGSFVCEFIDSKPTITYSNSTTSPDYGNVMTNFSNYLMNNGGNVQSHGAGYERWNTLARNYNADPKDLARMVFYSRMYSTDYNDPNYFWSEWATDEYPAQLLIEWRDNPQSRTGEKWENWVAYYNECKAKYDWRTQGWDNDHSRGSWFTGHSSIWDLKNKSLVLDIEEQDKFAAKINFDGTF